MHLAVQFFIFLNELRYIDAKLLSEGSSFNCVMAELTSNPTLSSCIEQFKKNTYAVTQAPHELIITDRELQNSRLSTMLDKLTTDPVALCSGGIPVSLQTIANEATFLLELGARVKYYKYGCSHITRALYYIYQSNKAKLKDLESARIGKLHKKKVKVSRNKVLEDAVVNMETYGFKKALLEFEFQDEEGTGIGPTLEYYSVVAGELKNPVHNLWRRTDSNLLFPSPIDPADLRYPDPDRAKKRQAAPEKRRDFEKLQLIFRCAGTLVARAILDERVVDLPFHPLFWNLVLDRVSPLTNSIGLTLTSLFIWKTSLHLIKLSAAVC